MYKFFITVLSVIARWEIYKQFHPLKQVFVRKKFARIHKLICDELNKLCKEGYVDIIN